MNASYILAGSIPVYLAVTGIRSEMLTAIYATEAGDSTNTNYPPVGAMASTGFGLLLSPQMGHASADTATVGGWTPSAGGTLFDCIDESPRADGDYIESGGNPSDDACIIKLAAMSDAGTDTGFHLQWAAGATGETGTIVGSLRQGNSPGTEIVAWTHSNLPVGSYAEFDDPITSGQAANITDFADLYLRFVAS